MQFCSPDPERWININFHHIKTAGNLSIDQVIMVAATDQLVMFASIDQLVMVTNTDQLVMIASTDQLVIAASNLRINWS